jgi:hypothetical protein
LLTNLIEYYILVPTSRNRLLKINNHPEKLRDWPNDVSATYLDVWC